MNLSVASVESYWSELEKIAAGPLVYHEPGLYKNHGLAGKFISHADLWKENPDLARKVGSDPNKVKDVVFLAPKAEFTEVHGADKGPDAYKAIRRHEMTHWMRARKGQMANFGKPGFQGVGTSLREELAAHLSSLKHIKNPKTQSALAAGTLPGTLASAQHAYPKGLVQSAVRPTMQWAGSFLKKAATRISVHPSVVRRARNVKIRQEFRAARKVAERDAKAHRDFIRSPVASVGKDILGGLGLSKTSAVESRRKRNVRRFTQAAAGGALGIGAGYAATRHALPKILKGIGAKKASPRAMKLLMLLSGLTGAGTLFAIGAHTNARPPRTTRSVSAVGAVKSKDRKLAVRHEGHPAQVSSGSVLRPREGVLPLGARRRSIRERRGGVGADSDRRGSSEYGYRGKTPRHSGFPWPVRVREHKP